MIIHWADNLVFYDLQLPYILSLFNDLDLFVDINTGRDLSRISIHLLCPGFFFHDFPPSIINAELLDK